jgi:biofilm protein TabA
MIVGLLADVSRQKTVLPAAIVRAIEALQKLDLAKLEPGRYELEGDKLFYLIQDLAPRSMDEGRPEVHHSYADVQIPCSAKERYGFSLPQANLIATEDRLESSDIAFYPTPANEFFMDITPGSYVVFLPKEIHRPCIVIDDKAPIRKAVVKIHASLLGL